MTSSLTPEQRDRVEKKGFDRLFASLPGLLATCAVCCFLWGSAFPSIKIGYRLFGIPGDDVSSQMLFAGVRFIIAGAMVIIGMSAARKKPLIPRKRDVRSILLLALFQTVLQYVFFYRGLSQASGVTSSIVTASSNFIAILLSCLAFRTERLTARKILGCAAGFGGVALINIAGMGAGETLGFTLGGEGMILLAAVAGAMSTCLIGVLGKHHDPVMLSGWQFLAGGTVLAIAAAAAGGRLGPAEPLPALALIVYMGFISAMAYSLWSRLLAVNPVSRVTVFGFMNPMFGFLLSMVLLDEGSMVNPGVAALALALVCMGIIIVNIPVRRTHADSVPNR